MLAIAEVAAGRIIVAEVGDMIVRVIAGIQGNMEVARLHRACEKGASVEYTLETMKPSQLITMKKKACRGRNWTIALRFDFAYTSTILLYMVKISAEM